MKQFLIATFLILSANVYSQEWTTDELFVLEYFGLSKDDHRGIIFQPLGEEGCLQSHSNSKDAFTSFFTTTIKRDITIYCLDTNEEIKYYEVIDLHQMVKIYLTTNK